MGIAVAYFFIAYVIGKCIKKGTIAFRLYVAIAILLPIWFLGGHKFYPSYSEFRSLCKNASISSFADKDGLEVSFRKSWVVKNRLKKSSILHVNSRGETVAEYTDYYYYPFGSQGSFMGAASGSAPRQPCPRPKKVQ